MSIKIPSPILARLQVMFNSGMSLHEVSRALELELTDSVTPQVPDQNRPHPPQRKSPQATAPESVPRPAPSKAPETVSNSLPQDVVNYLPGLTRAIEKIDKDVHSLSQHVKVKKSKSLSKASQNLIDYTQSLADLVSTINGFVPETPGQNSDQNADKTEVKVSKPISPPVPQGIVPSGPKQSDGTLAVPPVKAKLDKASLKIPVKEKPANGSNEQNGGKG